MRKVNSDSTTECLIESFTRKRIHQISGRNLSELIIVRSDWKLFFEIFQFAGRPFTIITIHLCHCCNILLDKISMSRAKMIQEPTNFVPFENKNRFRGYNRITPEYTLLKSVSLNKLIFKYLNHSGPSEKSWNEM